MGEISDLVLFLSINGRGNKPVEVKEFLVGLPSCHEFKGQRLDGIKGLSSLIA